MFGVASAGAVDASTAIFADDENDNIATTPLALAADDADVVDVEACVRRVADGPALGMTLLEIGTFTGFTPDADSIERLRAEGAGVVHRVDVDDRKVILYAEELPADNTTLCVRFRATRTHEVTDAKPSASTAMAYYHPESRGSAVSDPSALAAARRGGDEFDAVVYHRRRRARPGEARIPIRRRRRRRRRRGGGERRRGDG